MNDWIGDVTYLGIGGWTQTEYGTLISPPSISPSDIVGYVDDITNRIIDLGKQIITNKCSYCGQWGEPRTACEYCGAPIDPE